jgi:hypothetical protein
MSSPKTILNQLLNLNKRYWIAFTVFNVIIVSTLSLTPLDHLPHAPGGDKTHHLISYFLLIIPCALAKPKHWLLVAIGLSLWSGAIELLQPFVN